MASFDTIATLTLIISLTLIVYMNRKKLSFHRGLGIFYVAMYRTQVGIKTMDRIAKKYKRFWEVAAPWIIAIGFIGMAIVTFDLARSLINILAGGSTPSVGVVLPIKAKGVFYVPFLHWILSIFIILVVHEGMHGVMARVYGLKVRNSGLIVMGAVLPLIPGAFVEPDEKKLLAASPKKQLAVYAAGPFANIALALVLFAALTAFLTPITDTYYATNGVRITELMEGNPPAVTAGLTAGEMITQIDDIPIYETTDFSSAIQGKDPGDSINVITGGAAYDVTLGTNPSSGTAWLGVFVEQPLKELAWYQSLMLWFKDFVFWLFLLNVGVGLFNLVPLGPIDGGRMLLTAMQMIMKETRATAVWKSVSIGVLCVLLTNIVLAFV